MLAISVIESTVMPVDRSNVDTDAILPKQFLKSVKRTGYGDNLFDEWRYLDQGISGGDCSARPKNLECPLNDPSYAGSQILLTRENFGCGSSREHAVWALGQYGFRAIVGVSFADIFERNCLKNGVLTITLPPDAIQSLFNLVYEKSRVKWTITLAEQVISTDSGATINFPIRADSKRDLMLGIDDIERTLQSAHLIKEYEERRKQHEPWIFQ